MVTLPVTSEHPTSPILDPVTHKDEKNVVRLCMNGSGISRLHIYVLYLFPNSGSNVAFR